MLVPARIPLPIRICVASILFDAKRKFNGFDYHWVSIFAAVSSFLAELITNAVWLLYLILRVRFPIQL